MKSISTHLILLVSFYVIAIDATGESHATARCFQYPNHADYACSSFLYHYIRMRGGSEEIKVSVGSERVSGEEKIAFLLKGGDEGGTRIDHKTASPSTKEDVGKVASDNLRAKFADASISLQRLMELQNVKPIAVNFAMEIKGRYGETTSRLHAFQAGTIQRLRDGVHRMKSGDNQFFTDAITLSGNWMKDNSSICMNRDIAVVVGVFLLSLLGSSVGFSSFLYFVSVGYGASIGIIAAVVMLRSNCYSNNPVAGLANLHTLMTLLWSVRLIGFLLHREFINWPQWHLKLKDVNERATAQSKIAIWLTCASFYSLMMLPCVYRLTKETTWGIVGKFGICLQGIGLVLESVADYQKGRFKKQEGNRHRFCNVGIWNYFTHPNYLGEMIFWFGNWLGGIGGYSSILEWTLSTAGLLFVLVVMKGAIDSLSSKHLRNYGRDESFLEFRRSHSLLGPFPLTRLGKSSLPL